MLSFPESVVHVDVRFQHYMGSTPGVELHMPNGNCIPAT